MQSDVLEQVKEFAVTLLETRLSPDLYFHNLKHTREVVRATEEIGKHADLSPTELETVTMAAWFHDLGYCTAYRGHEIESVKIAVGFLRVLQVEESRIAQITACIFATRFPQQPVTLMEKVICDADFYHLSGHDYKAHEQALRKEWQAALQLSYTEHEWYRVNYTFLSNHSYWTPYGKTTLQAKKEENLKQLKQPE